ncbi:VTT domain-containing protein [Mollicutes bacterium LVI A0039]|nr:VTT domain-containing protein [Mollicutes bacterium LVI A0039]
MSILFYLIWIYYWFNGSQEKKLKVTKINMLLGLFTIAFFCIFKISMFSALIQENGVESVLTSYDGLGMGIYFTICYLQPIILPLPEPVTITAGSVVFGKAIGFLLGYLGSVLGIATMFIISRLANRKLNLNIINEKNLEKYNNLVKENEAFILILLFIFPILPDEVICVGAGLSPIKFKKFILIAVFSKLITVGLYSASSGIVKQILELGLIYQLAIVFTLTLVFLGAKKVIKKIKLHLAD